MKKILIFFAFLTVFFSSCSKEETKIEEMPVEVTSSKVDYSIEATPYINPCSDYNTWGTCDLDMQLSQGYPSGRWICFGMDLTASFEKCPDNFVSTGTGTLPPTNDFTLNIRSYEIRSHVDLSAPGLQQTLINEVSSGNFSSLITNPSNPFRNNINISITEQNPEINLYDSLCFYQTVSDSYGILVTCEGQRDNNFMRRDGCVVVIDPD